MDNTHPFVSILMPMRNEASFIKHSLGAVLSQNYLSNCMEIFVIDGMSTDSTCDIIADLISKFPTINLRVLENPELIVPIGLNIAIRQAKGEIIIRVDGHTIIAPNYVSRCVEALLRTNADNAGGCMEAKGDTSFGYAVAIATSTPFGVGNSRFHYSNKEEWVDSVYLGAWRREVFEHVGLFDEELVRDQDDEFNYRLRENGGRILLNPNIKSLYSVRSSPQTLWKQYYQYGLWKVRVLQKHPLQMSLRQFVPPIFTMALIISMLLTTLCSWGWVSFCLIGGSYLIANISACVITASRKGWQHMPLLLITYAILHLSYGTGFLSGLVKFSNRWGDKNGKVPELKSHHV